MSGVGRRDVFAMLGALAAVGAIEKGAEAGTASVLSAGVIDRRVTKFLLTMSADTRQRIGAVLGGERDKSFHDLCVRYLDHSVSSDVQRDVMDPAVYALLDSMTERDLTELILVLDTEQAATFFDIYRRYRDGAAKNLAFRAGVNLGAMAALAGLDVQEIVRFAREEPELFQALDNDFSTEHIQACAKSMRAAYDSGLRS